MKAVERAQASNPQFQVVLKESKDPTGPPAEHLQRTVPKDIKVVVGSDEDIVFFRLKNEPDIPIRKGTGRTAVGKNPVFVDQRSGVVRTSKSPSAPMQTAFTGSLTGWPATAGFTSTKRTPSNLTSPADVLSHRYPSGLCRI